MRKLLFALICVLPISLSAKIDRVALLERNSPQIHAFDSLASFSVGNGEFAYTADITGMQTFPQHYLKGVPLGTQSQWGWHSFSNPNDYKFEETLKKYNFRGKEEPYAVQFNEEGRAQEAANWYRVNPHRIHLGIIGFDIPSISQVSKIDQKLDLYNGLIRSVFEYSGVPVSVSTACHPEEDKLGFKIESKKIPAIDFKFPYPSGKHVDDGCDWQSNDKHSTEVVRKTANSVVLKRTIDQTVYYVIVNWKGKANLIEKDRNHFQLISADRSLELFVQFSENQVESKLDDLFAKSANYWNKFWNQGGIVDFTGSKDSRAAELERRIVLSQYLLAIQSSGSTPPQETGLTYNSWYGKFHLEMIWWHQSHFALWNHPELLSRTLDWYFKALPKAKEIAKRQGFDGARWMKMTDPSGTEAPSKVGSFLIWQQPHLIYLVELVFRSTNDTTFLRKFAPLVDETAKFMFSFADYDMMEGRYVLKGIIPAQETLRASETVNPPFELSYWYYAMNTAQKWRERMGLKKNLQWEEMTDKLSPLAYKDKLYLAAETAEDTYEDIRFTSDHMAVLGAWGILPKTPLVRKDFMQNTLNWIWDNWNWGKTWGWDYPMTAMNAARLGDPEKAVRALLMDKRTNTYLPNGHNYQDSRLRVYLPGNGGLLTAIALMCAGWDGCEEKNPGFPKNGNWKVEWEGLSPMP